LATERPRLGDWRRSGDRSDGGEESSSQPDRVIDSIYKSILSGRLVPGQKLIENELTKGIRVSRGSVREALKRLEAEGVVKISRNRGAYIWSLTRREAVDLLDILMVIIPFIGKTAAQAIAKDRSPVALDLADALLEEFDTSNTGGFEYLDLRSHFYDTLIAIGGNTQIRSVMPLMRIYLLRLQFHSFMRPKDRLDSLAIDRKVVEAVIRGDVQRSEKLIRQHFEHMHELFSQLPDEAFAQAD
jgi:DNA-binding GntR family transcriptional regulator